MPFDRELTPPPRAKSKVKKGVKGRPKSAMRTVKQNKKEQIMQIYGVDQE